jgi:hypothetical protein
VLGDGIFSVPRAGRERARSSAAHRLSRAGGVDDRRVLRRVDRYSFSTETEVVEALSPELTLLETWRGSYELGERCPHLTFAGVARRHGQASCERTKSNLR